MISALNNSLFLFFNSFAGKFPALDFFISFCATILPALYVLFLFAYFARGIVEKKEDRRPSVGAVANDLLFISLSGIIAYVAAPLVKLFFAYPRPFLALQEVTTLFQATGFSFPSGHAACMMALGAASALHDRRLSPLSFTVIILVGGARIIAGVHTPVDILGGYVLGAGIAFGLYYIRVFHNHGQTEVRL